MRVVKLILSAVFMLLAGSCAKSNPDAAPAPAGDKAASAAAQGAPGDAADAFPKLELNASRTNLVLTYIGQDGKYVDVSSFDKVPDAAKQQVIVTDLSLTPEQRQAQDAIVVADLTALDAGGNAQYSFVSRYPFEKLAAVAARKQWSDADLTAEEVKNKIILYTAPWCGVCKRAKKFLAAEGIPYVERDVEASERAAAELAAKGKAAGVNVSGVPVFDIGGRLMVGFDPDRVKKLAAAAGIGKTTL